MKAEAAGDAEPASADAGAGDAGGDDAEKAAKKPKRKSRAKAKSTDEADKAPQETAQEATEEEKPKKRSRRKKADAEAPMQLAEAAGDDDAGKGTTMAHAMEIDEISEPAPQEDRSEDDGDGGDAAEAEDKPAAKKRKPRAARSKASAADKPAKTRSARKKSGDDGAEEEAAPADDADDEAGVDARSDDGAEAETETDGAGIEAEAGDEEDAPRKGRRSRRRRKPRKDEEARQAAGEDNEDGDEEAGADASAPAAGSVESVGQEDALEEARIKRPRRQYKIQEVIRRRQVMLVQVVKEERGNKGAALTTYLSLAGRYSVLMPNTARGGGISRKITNPGDRKRLKEIAQSLEVPQGMGVILRTAGASRDSEEIRRDFDYLMRLWENVRNLTLASSAPFLVYEEGSLIKRSIRDLYNKDIAEVIVSGEEGYREARDFMDMLMPEQVRNVKLYQGDQPIFSRFGMENQLEKMVAQQVTLKSGGYLIINQTEALVAIDVNSGKSTREHSIEATALQTNLEAAEEVARQLRLRDLAGLVVIDFIDMEEKRNNRSVERKLKECLKNDRARIQVGHISHFGLLEMSRQRIRASVLESTMAVCPVCNGVGHVRSQSSLALMIVRALEDHLNRNSRHDACVRVAPAIAMYILNHKRRALSELESRFGVQITIEADHEIAGQDYEIEKGAAASGEPSGSAAISMMGAEPALEDAVSFDEDDNDGEGRDGRKRGKRRRGRGRGRDEGGRDGTERDDRSRRSARGDFDQDDEDGDDTQPASFGEDDSAAGEGTGRNGRPAGGAQDRPASPRSKADARTAKGASDDEEDEAGAGRLARPARPERRTGRPGRKMKTPEEAAAETGAEAVAEADEAERRDGAPPREIARRNTRRVRTPKPEGTSEDGDQPSEDEAGAGWSGFLS
ncbi:MAG: ribonuclease E/G [Nitratireductor sp.]|nr:ribonuclease E/G [Nitratireductor sp.]